MNETQLQAEQEKCLLQHKLDMQEKRHEVQTEYLKSVSSNVKLEHVTSLKQELHRTFQDKVDLQMYAQEMEDKCHENEEKIESLQKKNAKLKDGISEKEKQVKTLTAKLMQLDVQKKKKEP